MIEMKKDFTPDLESFLVWRSPRFGDANPTILNNPVWEWLIRTQMHPDQANELMEGPDSTEVGPMWCFVRLGQSVTELPDGRVVHIGGEYDDWYDPDFYIYNDVVVEYPDGTFTVFGYPTNVFPPTDFHTATLVNGYILLIGSLGYADQRSVGTTQVLQLSLDTFAVQRIETRGESPGCIHEHSARLSEDGQSVLVVGGLVVTDPEKTRWENIDEWELHLESWTWTRKTKRNWQRWVAIRVDRKLNHLSDLRWALSLRGLKHEYNEYFEKHFEEKMRTLEAETDHIPDLDQIGSLYRLDDSVIELTSPEDEYDIFRVEIDGIVVRFQEDMHSVNVIVEGELSAPRLDALQRSVLEKLTLLENAPWELEPL